MIGKEIKKKLFQTLWTGNGNENNVPNPTGKELPNKWQEKIGNGNSHLCLQCWYFTTLGIFFLNSLLHIADLTPYNSSLIVVNLIIGSEKWCIEKKKVPNNFFLKFWLGMEWRIQFSIFGTRNRNKKPNFQLWGLRMGMKKSNL